MLNMNYLVAGGESKERVALLLSLTKISSQQIKDSITDHLCKGMPEVMAASVNGVLQPNFNRAMVKINQVAATVEAIKEIDWAKLKSVK